MNGIFQWMFTHDLSVGDVAMVTDKPLDAVITELCGGRESSVIDYLRTKGCPEGLIQTRNIRRPS